MRCIVFLLVVATSTHLATASDATARIRDGFVAAGATYAGLAFDDARCKKAFGTHGTVSAAQHAKFGTCLRSLLDHGTESGGSSATTDTIDLETSTHGFELVFTCREHVDICRTDEAELTSVRAYDKAGAIAAVRHHGVDTTLPGKAGLRAVVHACFAATGAWKSSYVSHDSGDRTFDDAAARAVPHQITPYQIDGVAVPLCAELEFSAK